MQPKSVVLKKVRHSSCSSLFLPQRTQRTQRWRYDNGHRVFCHSGKTEGAFCSLHMAKSHFKKCPADMKGPESGTFRVQKSCRWVAKVVRLKGKCGTFDVQKSHTCNSQAAIYNCSNTQSAGAQQPTKRATRKRFFRAEADFLATTRFWRWILLLKFSNRGCSPVATGYPSR